MRRVRGRVGRDLERLNNMEQEVSDVQFDLRIIREDAHREAGGATSPALRRQPRPFQALVVQQQDKNKRDKAIRDRLSREKRQEQHKQDKREEYLNKAMHTRRPHNQVPKAHRNKKSVSSAFFQLMRPISSAFTSETASTYPKRTPAELDFTPSQKPAMVLDVVNARVSQFVNTERSFLFQVDTEDGGHYLLQALDKSDMKKWMETIERVSKMAAQRRLTYMGQNSKMQLSDHLLASNTTSRDPKAGEHGFSGYRPPLNRPRSVWRRVRRAPPTRVSGRRHPTWDHSFGDLAAVPGSRVSGLDGGWNL